MSDTMDIYAKNGDKVKFCYPENGMKGDGEYAKKYLVEGETYTVDYTVVGSWHSEVYLVEVPDKSFNTVLFEDAEATA